MKILKKLVEFIRLKFGTFVKNNTSIEDQYTNAANLLIDKITLLKKAHVLSFKEEKRVYQLSVEKTKLAEQKEKEIRHILAENPEADVNTHAKLGLLYRRTAAALVEKADKYKGKRDEIVKQVVDLDNRRLDLSVKLEYIRETKSLSALGISSAEDVAELAALTLVDVDDTLMKVETFNGVEQGTTTTQADVAEYLASLK